MEIESINPDYYTLNNFTFNNGTTLENLKVEYITFGTPKYDEEGHITNAVIYFHGTSGNYASIKRIKEAIGENLAFDTNKLFFVSLSTLGTPGSSSPSTSDMFNEYPEYTVLDMVNFNRMFLKEALNIINPLGLIGNSMGGFEALTWAAYYPNDIAFVISLVSSYKVGGQNYIIGKVMNDIIESDPDFGSPDKQMKRSLQLSSKAMYSFGLSRQYYMDLTKEEIDNYMDEFAQEDSEENVYDAYYRNKATINYDLTGKVSNIIAPTLIIAIKEDQYFPPELDAIPMHSLIHDSKLVVYNSHIGHIGSSQLNKIKDELEEFMKQFK
ncbi:MAG: alpha/beta fold hydrolase [Methanosphaera sp.]|uniref:alpha/beta fold hydrolase n=1 Tax=Methanosphaera sp. ISO3-F5 TaxID=1452353 RepID=UPI002B25FC89|nr:alpha/beta fold hydrolase [Methanosphaera sp. ISO3-F5]MBR0471876.1 alpha/beta fold hydrolase [Methanosphaera sp.]WQH64843.1 alpha/beta fold hydrolase [Methanosphaera sp. ISO3-F5]